MKDITTTNASHVGVILMTYGSPATLDDIPTYLKNVRGGRPAEDALITEFQRRYRLIGGSPLLRITREQAAALQEELNRQYLLGFSSPRGADGQYHSLRVRVTGADYRVRARNGYVATRRKPATNP